MINHRTYSFIIKSLILAFIFLSISLIVKSFISEDNEFELNSSIPFLRVESQIADSVIATLTTDEKIDLFVRTYTTPIPEWKKSTNYTDIEHITNQSDSTIVVSNIDLADTINSFHYIETQTYFNAISDTSLINNFLRNLICNSSSKNHFVTLNDNDIKSSQDSAFVEFFTQRFEQYKEIVHQKKSLFGLQLNLNQLKTIDSLKLDSTYFIKTFYEELRTENDFVLIDSFVTSETNLDFHGLVAGKIKNYDEKDKDTLIRLMEGPLDILVFPPEKINLVKKSLREILANKLFNQEILTTKLRKLVKAQIWQQQDKDSLSSQSMNTQVAEQQLVEKSICLLNNSDSIFPIKNIYNKKILIAWIGNKINQEFINNIKKYDEIQTIRLKTNEINWAKRLQYSQKRNFIIYVLDTLLTDTSNLNQLDSLKKNMLPEKSVFVNIGNYQNLKHIPDSIACIQTCGILENDYRYSAQAIFGGIALQGRLPYNITDHYNFAYNHQSSKTRLKYTIPEDAEVDSEALSEIDKIAWEGISRGAFPGCQIFVAKDGKVIYNKSFGYHTYARKNRVRDDDVYDLASVTKIAATTVAAMRMISTNKMSLSDKLGKFFRNTTIDYTRIKPDTVIQIDTFFISSIKNWPEFLVQNDTLNINDSSFITRDTIITKLTPSRNIFKVPLFDLLRHKSGIVPAMPVFRYMYYKAYFIKRLKEQFAKIHGKTGPMFDYKSFKLPISFPDNTSLPDSLKKVIKKGFKQEYNNYFSKTYVKDTSDIQLTKNLYFKNEYFDTVWRDTKQLPVFSRKVFQYSDVNMVLLQMAIDSLNNKNIDTYLKKAIYKQLGLKTITYLPLRYYGKHKIIPTEQDNSWRYGLLHGFVHDPSAALLGGMAGNAGLYSNAHDLGVLFQMVLNKGSYGGQQYLKPEIVELFTKRYDDSQRALGFDMPNRKAIVGKKASQNTFGHSGYTGTCVWVDPDNQLVYVFLSNRNHPKAENWRIVKYKIRERIHNAIYEAIIKKESKEETKLVAEK